MKKNVLLTGYSGFLGRHTYEALTAANWQVFLAGRSPPAEFQHAGYVAIDLESPETIAALRQHPPVQAIVHLACRVGWNGGSEGELLVPNVLATGMLADLSRHWGAHMIFASAALVHGATSPLIDSRSPVAADTPYGRSKLLGEELITASGTAHCILRMGGVFGHPGPSHLGINKAIASSLNAQPPTRVGQGAARRNYLFVKDAADAIVSAIDHEIVGTHLLAGAQVLSIGSMLEQICDTLNPGSRPLEMDGAEARDQIIESSSAFDIGRSFYAALDDIAREARTCASA